ncbi:hypothetical protein PGB90_004741 [Kerria lacca]
MKRRAPEEEEEEEFNFNLITSLFHFSAFLMDTGFNRLCKRRITNKTQIGKILTKYEK